MCVSVSQRSSPKRNNLYTSYSAVQLDRCWYFSLQLPTRSQPQVHHKKKKSRLFCATKLIIHHILGSKSSAGPLLRNTYYYYVFWDTLETFNLFVLFWPPSTAGILYFLCIYTWYDT